MPLAIMRITTFYETIWPCLKPTLDYLVQKRQKGAPSPVKSGLNFSIILGSACYLEGVLETLLRALLEHRRSVFNRVEIEDLEVRRAMNKYYYRIEEDLSRRIGRAIGAEGYNDVFELLAGQRLAQLKEIKPLWEGADVLFNFRNVLGHGRQVFARQLSGGSTEGGLKEEFRGGYRLVEEYLRKKKLLDRRFFEAHSEYVFLSDAIADHFWSLAQQVPLAVTSSLPEEEQGVCSQALATQNPYHEWLERGRKG